jgi:hypothetical protein
MCERAVVPAEFEEAVGGLERSQVVTRIRLALEVGEEQGLLPR